MKLKSVFLTLLLTLCSISVSAKSYCTPIYIYGLSASFNDSIVYITNIQILDSAWLDEKTDFLINRSEYSSQFKEYFNSKGQTQRTCIVTYAEKEKDILKKYAKMKSRYVVSKKKIKNFDLRTVDEEDFKFYAVKPVNTENSEFVVKKKSAKKTEKAKRRKDAGKLDKDSKKPSKGAASESEIPSLPPRH